MSDKCPRCGAYALWNQGSVSVFSCGTSLQKTANIIEPSDLCEARTARSERERLRADLERVTKERDEARESNDANWDAWKKVEAERDEWEENWKKSNFANTKLLIHLRAIEQQRDTARAQLRAELERVTKERDEARAAHSQADCELDGVKADLITARAQRDRAMVLFEECRPPDKAHDGPCHPDAGCDSSCSNRECWVLDYMDLVKEIAKAKEGEERAGAQRKTPITPPCQK